MTELSISLHMIQSNQLSSQHIPHAPNANCGSLNPSPQVPPTNNRHTHFGKKLRLVCQCACGEEPCTKGVIEIACEKESEAQTAIHTSSWLPSNYTQQPPLPPELQLQQAKLGWSENLSPLPLSLPQLPARNSKVKENMWCPLMPVCACVCVCSCECVCV